ncbi:ABC transporter ATP-binding protein [Microlunatus elymi]|uniref:ABC transporter ATP-binding protein n=1 Tax=Microlunatus elymi TaxID=2596828 RepID=A0A516PVD6_9ACTN|nr:ABC transporter ATP-binding protein [Microlunatus elymi]QDP94911.1 ABC transporter ATP-binding protein [Microlunatus elymi]
MSTAIAADQLRKSFGRTVALNGLDLQVETGEVHGFLGPNGAGKSTTIRILLGLLRSDSGTVELLGQDPWRHAVTLHRRLAYVPGDVELWPNLTGGEAIDLLGRLRGGIDPARRADLIERFDLDPTKKGRAYSKGNRQKVAIVAALASDAELLLLDEPTAGLDPLMEVVFSDVIFAAKDAGKTVLLSSHILAQVEKLADRVSIIRQGEIVQTGSLSQMRHLTRTEINAELAEAPTGLDQLPGVHDLQTDRADGLIKIKLNADGEHLDTIFDQLARHRIRSLISHPPTLEELMLRHYEAELKGNGGAADEPRSEGRHVKAVRR